MTAPVAAALAASLALLAGGMACRSPLLTSLGAGGLVVVVVAGVAGDGRLPPAEVAERLLREVGEEDES